MNRLPDSPLKLRAQDIPTWDSLGMLKIIAKLDEHFQILLTESELLELRSIGNILEVLRRNGHLNGAAAQLRPKKAAIVHCMMLLVNPCGQGISPRSGWSRRECRSSVTRGAEVDHCRPARPIHINSLPIVVGRTGI